MRNRIGSMAKWLALVMCILAAGFCYSCGAKEQEVIPVRKSELVTEEDSGRVSQDGESIPGYSAAEKQDSDEPVSDPEIPKENMQVCMVHVCGEVQTPGVYKLSEGQRIFEAIELAGGFTENAADDYLNLAQQVTDGMKIEVPDQEKALILQESGRTAAAGAASSSDRRISINSAGKEELMTLSGIGEARAEAIIRYREEQGPFRQIEEIMQVPGIKDSAFQKIKDKITADT